MNTAPVRKARHLGQNVKSIRDIKGMKQETLAAALGINQQKMSFIEAKPDIDEELLLKIASALNVPVEAIKNFDVEAAINIISNTFNDQAIACSFNPVDKVIELYERMLKEKDEQIAKLMAQN